MLTNRDYKTMLETGVDAGLLAIVESAFKVIFEASGKTVQNEMKPLPLDVVTSEMGIDISDCTGPEGNVNWNAVSRKLYEDSRFMAVDMKVNAIVRRALDIAGLKYVDDSGNPVYAYPRLSNNPEMQSIEENLKNGLKVALVKKFHSVTDPQKYIGLVDGISVDGAARGVARAYLSQIINEIQQKPEFSIGVHPLAGNPDDEYMHDEVPDENDRLSETEGNAGVVVLNEDGTKWTTSGNDEYSLMMQQEEASVISLDGNRKISTWYIYDVEYPDAPSAANLVHDLVNLYVKMVDAGKIAGIAMTRCIDYRQSRDDRELDRNEIYTFIAKNIGMSDIIRLIRCNDGGSCEEIFASGDDSNDALGIGEVNCLRFLIDCVDAGLLDADDLADWAEHSDDPEWIMSNADPRIMMMAKRITRKLFGRSNTQEAATELVKLLGRLLSYSHELIPALTGKHPARPIRRNEMSAAPMNAPGVAFSAGNSKLNAGLMKDPRMQVGLLKKVSPGEFLSGLRAANIKYGYVPLSREALDYMLMNSESEPGNELISNIIDYYDKLVRNLNSSISWDTRDRKMLFDEIKRNLDERIVSLSETFDDDMQLASLARYVPGFELPENYVDRAEHNFSSTVKYRGSMSPSHMVRVLLRLAHQKANKDEQMGTFMELCMGEPIRREYEKRTPVGKRLRNIFMSFAAEEPYLEDGEKGTPRNMLKLLPLTSRMLNLYLSMAPGSRELSTFFGTYLNGKDADVSRLYAIRSNQIEFTRGLPVLFAGLLATFARLFYEDEPLAISAFFGPRGGLLGCTTTEYVEVAGATGKKGNRRPVQRNELGVRLAIAHGLAHIGLEDDARLDNKAFIYVANECLAGQHLILSSEAEAYDLVGVLMYLSGYYDNYGTGTNEGDAPRKNIVDLADIDTIISDNPGKLLKYMRTMPKIMAKKLCSQYFTEETVRNMGRTREGIKLFLKIAELGEMGDAQWGNFAAAFAAGNANNIKNLIKTLPADEAERLTSKLSKYINAANNTASSKFTAVSGSEVNSQLGATVQYSMANGLRWMKGYVTTGNPAAMSENGEAGLYSIEDAATMFGSVPNGWRLPTVDEILHLGDNPDTISEESLGFTGTGMADAEGELISGSEDFCFAWCMGKEGPVGYSVDSNNVIEVNDGNIEPGFKLAIKLVR